MKITAIDQQPYPVWLAPERNHAPKFYRAVLPARMTGGKLQSEMLIGRDGESPEPVKLFEEGALDKFNGSERLTVAELGTPSLIAWREFDNPALTSFIHALIASRHDIRFDADDNLLSLESVLIPGVSGMVREAGIKAIANHLWMSPLPHMEAARKYDEMAAETFRRALAPQMERERRAWADAMQPANDIVAATETCACVRVAPNAIDPADFPVFEGRRAGSAVNIGYSGSITHGADIRIALPGLLKCVRKLPNVHLHFFGWHPHLFPRGSDGLAPGHYTFEDVPYSYHGQNEIADYYRKVGILDVAVAPLVDDAFSRTKSAQKWFEHSMHGTAMVVSDLHPYNCVEHGVTGLKAAGPNDFTEHLMTLCTDHSMRRRIGEAARLAVLKSHTVEACRQPWIDAVSGPGHVKPARPLAWYELGEPLCEEDALRLKREQLTGSSVAMEEPLEDYEISRY